ncbi:MAG: FMN-binding glutamate synthase family protein [Gammaproteobacteria bacterium]|nr:MAG: FMN-binding glutamate synthase family protein [Gammaproteobacteria bacterium]
MRKNVLLAIAVSFVAVGLAAWFLQGLYWVFLLLVPIASIALYDVSQKSHSLWRNFPVIGRSRWLMERFRPFIRQYFLESDTDGTPINRMFRSVVYQRSKGQLDTVPYGTRVDTYRVGYEWIAHSIRAIDTQDLAVDLRVTVGSSQCQRPYSMSLLNVSAMSFGALSGNAILALNQGAEAGRFAHNTGEGGISDYHREGGGDLIWQIGTAYFGCRDSRGHFDAKAFQSLSVLPAVKMIEIKISQGAKPGHGGILPADKNTPEIAKIRLLDPHIRVDSPAAHSEFQTPVELLEFVAKLRRLSGGKPVGIKLCIGRRSEFVALCKAMIETKTVVDFITVDGGEGGTGAAPLEYANSVGMPLREGIAFVYDCLVGFDLKSEIKIIASGKIISGFHLVKNIALGADLCYSARAMMLALGCVQALQCNLNTCPTGIATQDQSLAEGLVVPTKAQRVQRYHYETLKSVAELLASAGLSHADELNRTHIFRRTSQKTVTQFDSVFPYSKPGCLLAEPYPESFAREMKEAHAESFTPRACYANFEEGLQEIV